MFFEAHRENSRGREKENPQRLVERELEGRLRDDGFARDRNAFHRDTDSPKEQQRQISYGGERHVQLDQERARRHGAQ